MSRDLLVLVVLPLLVGLGALAGGIVLLVTARSRPGSRNLRVVLGILCLLLTVASTGVAFVMGSCLGIAKYHDSSH